MAVGRIAGFDVSNRSMIYPNDSAIFDDFGLQNMLIST